MKSEIPLPDRFPDADFVLKATMWTPERNALETWEW